MFLLLKFSGEVTRGFILYLKSQQDISRLKPLDNKLKEQ